MNDYGISIIAPSFNQGKYIQKMIDSVLAQDYSNFELIVVDGGSTDSTVEVLKTYSAEPRIRWVSERDNGPVDAVNKGFSMARNPLATIISTDDFFLPGAFREAVAFFRNDDGLSLVYAEYVRVSETGQSERIVSAPYSLRSLLSNLTFVPQGASFFRLNVARRLGGWDMRIPYVPDTDLWFRMALTSNVAKCESAWIGSQSHAEQRTNQLARVLRDYQLMLHQMQELKHSSLRNRCAAWSGFQLLRMKFGGMSDALLTWTLWKAVLLNPQLLFSGRIPFHRLVPGYFLMTSGFRGLRNLMRCGPSSAKVASSK
jgi:glycosyltransferase involved in cell wall biosynthesis